MTSRMGRVKIRQLDSLQRARLICILMDFKDCPQISFSRTWLEEQPTEKLRLLLLAARLCRGLRLRAATPAPSPETA